MQPKNPAITEPDYLQNVIVAGLLRGVKTIAGEKYFWDGGYLHDKRKEIVPFSSSCLRKIWLPDDPTLDDYCQVKGYKRIGISDGIKICRHDKTVRCSDDFPDELLCTLLDVMNDYYNENQTSFGVPIPSTPNN